MENLNRAFQMIHDQFEIGSTVWMCLFGAVIIFALVYLFRALYIHVKRSVESVNYIILCVPILAWAFLIFAGPFFGLANSEGTWARAVIVGADYFFPPLLMFHIWSQVSYRPIRPVNRVAWFLTPAILLGLMLLVWSEVSSKLGAERSELLWFIQLASNAYFVVVMIHSYLLCFNVFYQMPKHMRRSTWQLLLAISVVVAARGLAVYFAVSDNIENVLVSVSYLIVIYSLYTAFFIANSSNVIVTSRDFVYSSLSTIVITVSLKGNILDWNHKQKNGCHPLPSPKYKEPYALYLKRILATCDGVVSPHDESILNIKCGGREYHFLFTWHEISYKGRKFGFLVEIAEITKSYAKLRYFEEIAFYDNLTSLYSRNAYMERVKQIADPAKMPLLIVVGDVNNLKKINDSLGHLHGDRLLLSISNAVKANAPKDAFVARIGGDELVLLLENADESAANAFTEAVTEALSQIKDPHIGTPSISWGCAVMRDAAESYNDAFRTADAMMYEAKRKAHEVSISGIVPQEAGKA